MKFLFLFFSMGCIEICVTESENGFIHSRCLLLMLFFSFGSLFVLHDIFTPMTNSNDTALPPKSPPHSSLKGVAARLSQGVEKW